MELDRAFIRGLSDMENEILQLKWHEEKLEFDFFDFRYKGKKWTREEIEDGEKLNGKFEKEFMKLIKSKKFDWEQCFKENGGHRPGTRASSTNMFENFSKNTLEILGAYRATEKGGIGIKIRYRRIRYTTQLVGRTRYREQHFNLREDKEGMYIDFYGERKSLHAYTMIDDNFILNEKIKRYGRDD
jgi:hypothetical protein